MQSDIAKYHCLYTEGAVAVPMPDLSSIHPVLTSMDIEDSEESFESRGTLEKLQNSIRNLICESLLL